MRERNRGGTEEVGEGEMRGEGGESEGEEQGREGRER